MGYDSNYHLQTIGPDARENKAVLDEIETASGYHFNDREDDGSVFRAELEDATWYDWMEHCAAVAKRHPRVYIEVTRDGEERDDNEITRFYGDLQETIVSESSWPPFRSIILPAEQAENPFFLEAESIRPLLNIATWRHVLGVILDHRIDDGSWPPAEERLDVLLHIVDDIDSSDESLIREWYNGNEDVLIPDRLDGFEEAKATWVRPWREAIEEITRRVGAGEVTARDALMALTICDNSYTPVRGNYYANGRHTYASLADLVVSVGCSYARSQQCDDRHERGFLKSYIKIEEDERD